MRERGARGGAELETLAASERRVEAAAFLDWLAGDNFTFLGYRDYDATGREPGSGILRGLARSEDARRRRRSARDSSYLITLTQGQLALDRAPRRRTSTTSA